MMNSELDDSIKVTSKATENEVTIAVDLGPDRLAKLRSMIHGTFERGPGESDPILDAWDKAWGSDDNRPESSSP